MAWLCSTAAGQDEDERLIFMVTRLELAYADPHPRHPNLEEIAERAEVTLVEVERVLYAPDAAPDPPPGRTPRVREISVGEIGVLFLARLDASAVAAVSRGIVRAFEEVGIGGVQVAPDPGQIGPGGEDLRRSRADPLRLIIRTARVTSLRTVAVGDRLPEGAVNHPAHEAFRERSPVQPHEAEDEDAADEERKDLLFTDQLDRFLARIGRHPGRFARANVRPDEEPGGDLALDLAISEAKPWLVFAQVSDTGTEATGDLRYRFGFIHNQLTGSDDTLSVSYVTSDFSFDADFEAIAGSYEAPVGDAERLRWRAFGSWSEFSAAELGRDEDAFLGETVVGGGSFIANVAQFDDLFIDVEAGGRFESIETTNRPAFISGSEDVLIGSLGVTVERFRMTDELTASLRLEGSSAGITGSDAAGLTELGRTDPAEKWALLGWDASYSFFLEPVIDREAWEDPSTPESSTLAHEIVFRTRGQWAFGNRLVPQQQGIVGGLFSVRGYPESIAAGDTSIAASAEYRFHLPRVFGIRPDPQSTPIFGRPFRVAPQQVYGAPDWDLVLKAFVDGGRVWQSERRAFERDESLLSFGTGVELTIRSNVTARLDFAVAAMDVGEGGSRETSAGDSEVHFVITVSY